MSKVKVTTRFRIVELIDRFVDGALADSIGGAITDQARQMIADGVSPVRGFGRFERYKDRKKYPGKKKDARPVNLYLTGEMLDKGYGFRRKDNETIEVGMIKGSQQRKDVASYLNDGTRVMHARPFLPQQTEEFAVTIMRRIRALYGERLQKLIAQSNKKT